MKLGFRTSIHALLRLLICIGVAATASAQSFITMFFFDGTNGSDPGSQPIQGPDWNLYSTTFSGGGGTHNQGTIYGISPSGKLTAPYNVCAQAGCPDGAGAVGLTLVPDGNFYGETYLGGSNAAGTIFKITPEGKLTTLYRFCTKTQRADGANPEQPLFLATGGDFYGIPTSGRIRAKAIILGNDLTRASGVTLNGTPAQFKVISGSEIKTTVPAGATTGKVKVTTLHGTLVSNVDFRVAL